MIFTPPTEGGSAASSGGNDGGDNVDGDRNDGGSTARSPQNATVIDPTPSYVRTPIRKNPAAVAIPSSNVLAAAITETDDNSFSFDVGMNMTMDMMGMSMSMAPEEPVMSGEASGDRMHAVMDMGTMMSAMTMTDEQGNPVPVPELDELGDLRFEMWLDGTVMTVDMSAMAAIDPSVTGPAAQGAVSFDLVELANDFGVDDFGVDEVTSEMLSGANMYPGMGSMDPAAIGDVLRGLDTVVEVGRTEVNGRPVTVYSGTVSMAEYSEAMGQDVWAELGQMNDVGSADEVAAMMDAIIGIDIEMTVMIDDDDLLRRLEMFMDLAPMFEAMFAGDGLSPADAPSGEDELGRALEEAFEAMFAEMDMTVFTWMEFDDYGESFEFDPPPAVDLTADATALFGDSVTA